MQIPAESLSVTSVRDKVVTAAEAVRLIRDGDSVVVEGFVGQGFAEELTLALEERFLQSGTPQDLSLVFTVAQGDRQGRGLDRLCHEGLLKLAVGGHWGLAAGLGTMAVANTKRRAPRRRGLRRRNVPLSRLRAVARPRTDRAEP